MSKNLEKIQLYKELTKLKEKYLNVYDDLCIKKADGELSKLCNLRDQFDETFDQFFDQEEIRKKYNCVESNEELETMFDNEDLQELINFYKNYIGELEDELNTDEIDPDLYYLY
jgi:hypothetical protein